MLAFLLRLTVVIQPSSLIDLFRRCPNQFEKNSDPLGFDEDPLNSGRYGGSGGVTRSQLWRL